MSTKVINTIYQFKRGTAARWAELNPVLKQGEPGFAYDTHELKIGDGFTPWNELPCEGNNVSGVFSAESVKDFPPQGEANLIYKAELEKALYQYNTQTNKYEKLNITPNAGDDYGVVKSSENAIISDGMILGVSTDLLFQGINEIIIDCGTAKD